MTSRSIAGVAPDRKNLLNQNRFSGLKVIKLETRLPRSTGRIMEAANQLIGNNTHLFEASWSDLGRRQNQGYALQE